MPNIFNVEDNLKLRNRVQKLTADSQPLWGKMTAAQMVLHCQKPMDVAEGKLLLKPNLIGFLFGKIAKRDFLKNQGFKKNLPTAPQFMVRATPDFGRERQTLLLAITCFGDIGPAVIKTKSTRFSVT